MLGPNNFSRKRGLDDETMGDEQEEPHNDSKRVRDFPNFGTIDDELEIIRLRQCITEGPDRGKSTLWLWCAENITQHPTAARRFLMRLKNHLTIDDFRVKALNGPDKGQSLFWIFAKAATDGYTIAFMTVFELWGKELTLADLRTCAEEGPCQGQSVLFLLAMAERYLFIFRTLLDKFGTALSPADFEKRISMGKEAGTNVLWQLAAPLLSHHAFHILVLDYPHLINHEALRAAPEGGEQQGQSVLWLEASAIEINGPKYFLALLRRHYNLFTMQDLRQRAAQGPKKGTSVLYHVAKAAGNGTPEDARPFLHFWFELKKFFTLADLMVTDEADPLQKSVMHFLLTAAIYEYINRDIVEYLFAQIPELGTGDFLTSCQKRGFTFQHNLERIDTWGMGIINLIKKKHDFTVAFRIFEQRPGQGDRIALYTLAHEATVAGYMNAFFDLATLYLKWNDEQDYIAMLMKVPKDSCRYQEVCVRLGYYFYGLAKQNLQSVLDPKECLEYAIKYALHDPSSMKNLWCKIAHLYIANDWNFLESRYNLSDFWFRILTENTPLAVCFALFDDLKQEENTQTMITKLRWKIWDLQSSIEVLRKQVAERGLPEPESPNIPTTPPDEPIAGLLAGVAYDAGDAFKDPERCKTMLENHPIMKNLFGDARVPSHWLATLNQSTRLDDFFDMLCEFKNKIAGQAGLERLKKKVTALETYEFALKQQLGISNETLTRNNILIFSGLAIASPPPDLASAVATSLAALSLQKPSRNW